MVALLLLAGLLLSALIPAPVAAQEHEFVPARAHALPDAPTVRGILRDEEGGALGDVRVEARGLDLTARSDEEGRFALRLPAGTWWLHFERLGVRTDSVRVRVPEPAVPAPGPTEGRAAEQREGRAAEEGTPRRLRVELRREPVRLAPLHVAGRGEGDADPEAAAPSHTLPASMVRRIPGPGEPDVFRALRVLPAASQPNDLQGRLHLAGGAGDETGMTLDGHPLQSPFHFLGLTAAVPPAALEATDLAVHHLTADRGDRLSGLVHMRTAAPEGGARTEMGASLLGAGLAALRPDLGGAGGPDLLAAARLGYASRVAPRLDDRLPALDYADAVARVGVSPGGGWRVEAVGFAARNIFRGGEVRALEPADPLRWGETMVGVRLLRPAGPWELRLRGSFDRAESAYDERPAGGDVFVRQVQDRWSGAASLALRGAGWDVRAGASADHRWHERAWAGLAPHRELISPRIPDEHEGAGLQTLVALFGTAGVEPVERVRLELGARAVKDPGRPVWRGAPRVLLSVTAAPGLRVEAAANRRFQYTSWLEEPIEHSLTPPEFLLTTPRRADVLSAGVEWAAGSSEDASVWARLRVDGYWKSYANRTRLVEPGNGDPSGVGSGGDPGTFPAFERVGGEGWGALLTGRLGFGDGGLLMASYAWQRAREPWPAGEDAGEDAVWRPVAWETPHDLSLAASVPVGGWTLTGAAALRSGIPATPIEGVVLVPGGGDGSTLRGRPVFGEPAAGRLPAYLRLDVGVRRGWRMAGGRWAATLQVLNVTDHENPLEPDVRQRLGLPENRTTREGLPLVPSLGVEVVW